MLTDNCLVQRIFPFTHKLFFTKKEKEFKDWSHEHNTVTGGYPWIKIDYTKGNM